MSILELLRSAVSNSLRSKTRTTLTVIAIFIGAFTLTLTSGIGTGINQYIDTTVSAIGADDVMTVTKNAETTETLTDGPREYDPDTTTTQASSGGPPGTGTVIKVITPDDLDTIAAVPGVVDVTPTISISGDYVAVGDGTRYEAQIGSFVAGVRLDLASGQEPDNGSSDLQVAIPVSFVEPLGFADNDDAIGQTLTIAVTDAEGTQSTVDASIVGVSNTTLAGTEAVTPNDALTTALHEQQSVGLSTEQTTSYSSATVHFDPASTDEQISALKTDLDDAGFTGTTVDDQIGSFKTVIDGIVLVLNGFAIIALLAAGFGIVNTLLMSVQERTREIGLMKAMGMSGGKVFGLFSLEAVFIGFLGSAIGVGVGMLAGTLVSNALSASVLSGLPGLTLVAFDPVSIGSIVLAVMGIAFLAGTIPALRAARQDPIESLRYE
ncbi:putative ABC transport system permease protein [Homoserinimonas aerilata]|uniref:Putative ABC transport system permease protein n=1 Tax=Homoserinimonas aerilata TaxID=1162970 RepID=A0A542Y1R4_9MICO|nr:ABC transporter permease [Homoserinimonas aerilata]TQL41953.1 putative ABC transport system permease protein [Homoserinimonas aerilata]